MESQGFHEQMLVLSEECPFPPICRSLPRTGYVQCGKGKRGDLRVVYHWWDKGSQFWMFTVYDKDEMADLTPLQRKALKEMVKKELEARRKR